MKYVFMEEKLCKKAKKKFIVIFAIFISADK